MKSTKNLSWIIVVIGMCLCAGCEKNSTVPPTGKEKQNDDYDSLEKYINDLSNPKNWESEKGPRQVFRLPNYEGGPGRPMPNYLNFYTRNDRFSSYLQCEYPVKEMRYEHSKESEWFKVSLEQIRKLGQKKFPPLKWIAVIIFNTAEHKGASTFEKSYKVGAIFNADEVFDSSQKLSQLVAQAKMDRHPFMYDKTQPTPGKQRRWLIIEKHAHEQNKK